MFINEELQLGDITKVGSDRGEWRVTGLNDGTVDLLPVEPRRLLSSPGNQFPKITVPVDKVVFIRNGEQS